MKINIGKTLAIPTFLVALGTGHTLIEYVMQQSTNWIQLVIYIACTLIPLILTLGLWRNHYLARYAVIVFCIFAIFSPLYLFIQPEPVNVFGIEDGLRKINVKYLVLIFILMSLPYLIPLILLFTKRAKKEFAKNVA